MLLFSISIVNKKCFLATFFVIAALSIQAQDTTSPDYFSIDKPENYPPYDSSQLKWGKRTLVGGHLIHAFGTRTIQASFLSRAYNMDLNIEETLISGFVASSPAIIRALSGDIHPNAIWLNHHGVNMGFVYGRAAMGIADNPITDFNDPVNMVVTSASSIGLGALGYHLGRTQGWDDNRVSLYKHYSTLGSAAGFFISSAFENTSTRIASISTLAGAVGGYCAGHFKARHTDKTRGDYLAVDAFTLYQAYFTTEAILLINDNTAINDNHSFILLPALTIGGSSLSQLWLKNARLSRSQGKILGSILGASPLIHLLLDDPLDSDSKRFITFGLTYLTGGITYKLILDKMKNDNLEKRGASQSNMSLSPALFPVNRMGQSNFPEAEQFAKGLRLNIRF